MMIDESLPRSLAVSCVALALGCALAAGCGQDAPGAPAAPAAEAQLEDTAPSAAEATTAQATAALTDPQGPNFFVAGGAHIDLVGADGEPDEPAGRLVTEGTGITAGAPGPNGWLVVSPTGKLSFLDESGEPQLGFARDVLENNAARFAALGQRRLMTGDVQSAWLIGGDDGRIHMVNQDGEPEMLLQAQLRSDEAVITAGAWGAGAEQWLVGTDGGEVIGLNNGLDEISSEALLFTGQPIVGIVSSDAVEPGKQWLVAGANGRLAYFPEQVPIDLAQGVELSSLDAANGRVVLGARDGRVALWDFVGASDTVNWIDVFDGQAVEEAVWNGQEWLLLGEQGRAARLDDDGTLQGEVVTLGDGSTLVSANWVEGRWLIASRAGFVFEVDATLAPAVDYAEPLGGAEVLAAAPGGEVVVVAGEGGAWRVLDWYGQPISEVQTSPSGGALHAVSWSGRVFVVAGEGGQVLLVSPQGEVMGEPLEVLEGRDVEFAAWSGDFWLLGGAEGYTQRLRPDGTIAGPAVQLAGFELARHARWSGSEWMVVGESGGQGVFQLVRSGGEGVDAAQALGDFEALYAVDWNGREWIVGGTGGMAQLISAAGTPRTQPMPMPREVLPGRAIRAIDFHDGRYIVAGDGGLTRLVNLDLQPAQPPVAVAAFSTIRTIRWTRARGHGQGACLTNDVCFVGECLGGGLADGFCCDKGCSGGCESCFEEDTAQPNGVCAPLAEGDEPIEDGTCEEQDPSTCGETGLCDGQGGCQLHSSGTECVAAGCSEGQENAAASCDGQGMCAEPEITSCEPYAGCEEDACASFCSSSAGCSEGYVCDEGVCAEQMEPEPMMMPEPEDPEEGCCAVVRPRPQPPGELALVGLIGLWLVRRRRRGGRA